MWICIGNRDEPLNKRGPRGPRKIIFDNELFADHKAYHCNIPIPIGSHKSTKVGSYIQGNYMGFPIAGKVLCSSDNVFCRNMGAIDIISELLHTETEMRYFCERHGIETMKANYPRLIIETFLLLQKKLKKRETPTANPSAGGK